ncbi:HofO family protein [Candidatus Pantoea soli]|uniref:DNA utilization protein HofO C-terminal domain-containing protein n=1 Tax=Candidatus Pantoea soli TaxID=3098669 RepID=A0A518XGG9_9GAMM|nr:hypothetical protein [Pantoea soli]QDY43298.1 hypothetical protein D8B20_16060 [Pantoea soli]
MSDALQRWLALPPWWRISTLAGIAMLILLLAWWGLLRPQQQVRQTQQRLLTEKRQQQHSYQKQLASRPSIATLRAEIDRLEQSALPARARQSLEQLVAARGHLLESWQPDSQPPQLALQLSWPEFVPLFAALAETALPVPQRFQLESRAGRLSAQLWLEADDAS